MIYAFLFGAHSTHDIALVVFGCTEIVHYASEVAQTLLAAPIWVECTVARWLVGVEITLR